MEGFESFLEGRMIETKTVAEAEIEVE